MKVVCPHCGFDAGDVAAVEIGSRVECVCNYKWIYTGPQPLKTKAIKGIAATLAKATGNAIATGFRKVQAHIERRQFSKRLPEVFIQAAADGVITEEEEASLRRQLKEHGIAWEEAAEEIKPLARDFVRRVMADVVADGEVARSERRELRRYLQLFGLEEMGAELEAVLGRVETIWKLNNGVLPAPLSEKPLWLRSDEALYFCCDSQHFRTRRGELERVSGTLFVTNTRFEFISPNVTFSHWHEQLRLCDPVRRTHLSLLFHPKVGSGTYIVPDAPLTAAYLNAMARAANRTITISREDSTLQERRRIPKEVKHEVWIRDGGRCVECRGEDYLEFDHIIPVSRGGSNSAQNIQLLCRRCNGEKSDKI
jgi:tellurite resistance protein